MYICVMSRKNWNYKTTRNHVSNQVYNGFKITGDKKYNKSVIKKYFVDDNKINNSEKKIYDSLREQI